MQQVPARKNYSQQHQSLPVKNLEAVMILYSLFLNCRAAFCDRVRRRFCNDRRGNVAIMFVLAIVPMLGLGGGVVDYSSFQMSMDFAQRRTVCVKQFLTGLGKSFMA